MPNYCSNSLVIRGASEQLRELQYAVTTKDKDGNEIISILDSLVPTPKELIETMSGGYGYNEDGSKKPEQIDLEEKYKTNIAKYGHKDWYDWNIANWGTKWSDGDTTLNHHSPNELHITFESAWSPPVQGFVNISKLYPELVFVLSWEEQGMDFYGACALRNGEKEVVEGEISKLEGWTDVDYDDDGWEDAMDMNSETVMTAREIAETKAMEAIGASW